MAYIQGSKQALAVMIKIRFAFYWFLIKLQNAIIYIIEFISKSARGRLISRGLSYNWMYFSLLQLDGPMGSITGGDSAYKR